MRRTDRFCKSGQTAPDGAAALFADAITAKKATCPTVKNLRKNPAQRGAPQPKRQQNLTAQRKPPDQTGGFLHEDVI
ncbi:MAG: hypothetical protein PUC32_06215 [Oscillospiraceae bacterium]|nr:hypothetical protein [Oscillospiraceae bacterium]